MKVKLLNSLVEKRLPKKIPDPFTSPKSYWSTLKTFLNYEKILCITP